MHSVLRIADDHQFIVEDLKEELEDMLPAPLCIRTTELKEILSLCEQYHFDVVFMDIEMPGANGIQIAGKILEAFPRTNIIYITGHTGYAFQSYQTFASAFLERPISTEKLRRALDNLRYPVSNLTDEMIEQEYAGKAIVGKQIQKWREEIGMSRQELADALKVDLRTVYRWESAERSPDIPTYMRILKILGKSSDIV